VTYPNVLVLDYLKKTQQLTPETQLKAEQFIGLGYQRLLTFEVPGGGFSLFGQAPAILNLTAYGLLEFNDMAGVYPVDPALLQRTARWLMERQNADGTWGNMLDTALVSWALIEAGHEDSPEVQRALDVLRTRWQTVKEQYVLGLIANALAAAEDPTAAEVLRALESMKIVDGDTVHWSAQGPSLMGVEGRTGDMETTALIVYAMLRAGQFPESVQRGLTYLIRQKDSFGTWYSTQATILSLKTLILATTKGGVASGEGKVTVSLNGAPADPVVITQETADVVHSLVFDDVPAGDSAVEFKVEGGGNPSTGSGPALMYQVTAEYYVPWDQLPPDELAGEAMTIDVSYDRTTLVVNDEITGRAQITLNRDVQALMVLVDLGVPPGFAVEAGDLDLLVEKGVIQRYELTGRQIIVYIENMQPKMPVDVSYRLRARYPIKAKVPPSNAYDYYNPDTQDNVAPVEFVVE
jgi:hypothetical protein